MSDDLFSEKLHVRIALGVVAQKKKTKINPVSLVGSVV